MKKALFTIMFVSIVMISFANEFDPPQNFTVNATSSTATWDAPANGNPTGYQLLLGNSVVATVAPDVFSYQFTCLQYNEEYTASVKAMYGNNISDAVSYSWTSTYLRPIAVPFASTTYGSQGVTFNFAPIAPCDTTTSFDLGLLSVNVYRDGMLIGNTPYDPSGSTIYYDNPVPGNYNYCTEALWDLSPYGLAGQVGVSMLSCQNVEVAYGFILPFVEDWSSSSFEFQQWISDGDWAVDVNGGNSAPSAKFEPGNQLTNYESPLTSGWFNMDTNSTGIVYLSYDLKLDNINPTGNEQMKVQILHNDNWQTLKTYSNSNSFDWISDTLTVTNFTLGEFFQIRFDALGANSNDISAWHVDNISLFIDYESALGISHGYSEKTNGFIMFPNPAKGIVTIKSEGVIQHVAVYDFLGKEIFSAGNNEAMYSFNTQTYSPGIYLVKVQTNYNISLQKLVVR